MKKAGRLLAMLLLLLGLSACGSKDMIGDCECLVEVTGLPKEMDMLDENIQKQIFVCVVLENVYTEKSMNVKLYQEDDFKKVLKLKPGTYRIEYSYAGKTELVPLEVKEKKDSVEVLTDKKAKVEIEVTNPEVVADWIWNQEAGREILQEKAFSRRIQFEGQMIDLTDITDYASFEYDKKIPAYKKAELTSPKGIAITVLNESEEPADWEQCTLKEVRFAKSNVIWGQGAFVGMTVKDAVHATEGLYGMPTKMAGTVLAGMDYEQTEVSWLDGKSGDKLTLVLDMSGSHIHMIRYELAVFE